MVDSNSSDESGGNKLKPFRKGLSIADVIQNREDSWEEGTVPTLTGLEKSTPRPRVTVRDQGCSAESTRRLELKQESEDVAESLRLT